MKLRGIPIIVSLGVMIAVFAGAVGFAGAANPIPGPVALMYVSSDKVEWKPNEEFDGLTLTVTGPNDTVYNHDSNGREIISFYREDDCGNPFPDGEFTYELRVRRELSQEEMELIAAARLSCESLGIEEYKTPLVQSGTMMLVNGEVVFEIADNQGEGDFDPGERRLEDHLIYDDLIVTGSECIGFDCANGESFGYDTLILKEHNLRIYFNDTSYTGSYPTRSWRIQINSQDNGGGSWFAVQDADEGTTPFKIEGTAPSSSLYVDDSGRVGFGTSSPVLELHVKDGDTPSLRLQQDASYGWDAQTWDVCGNESNFFIRDATNGSKLPFRIEPGAPSSSIAIREDGDVGIGTWSPTRQLEVSKSTGSLMSLRRADSSVSNGDQLGSILFTADDGSTGAMGAKISGYAAGSWGSSDYPTELRFYTAPDGGTASQRMVIDRDGNVGIGDATPDYELDVNGDIYATGTITPGCSRELKENIADLTSEEAMAALTGMKPVRFNYKADKEEKNIGFIAEDVPDLVATNDRKGVSTMDVAAVLTRVVQEQQRLIREMARKNEAMARENERSRAELLARIVELERDGE